MSVVTASKLTASASLLHNNLAVSAAGFIAGIHNSVNSGGGKVFIYDPTTQARDGPEITQATSIHYLSLPWGVVLCVCSGNGTHVYTEDAYTMLFYHQVAGPDKPDVLKHHRGACVVYPYQQIVVGSSSGSLIVFTATAENAIGFVAESPAGGTAQEVADVCYHQLANAAFSAHDDGEIRVWTPAQAGPYVNTVVIPPVGQAPVRIAALGARVLVAYATGHIRLFDAIAHQIQVEITAHARNLTAVAVIDNEHGQVASVGEDTVLNVWLIEPNMGQVSLQHSSVVASKLLTGVGFHATGCAVSAYDSDELYNVTFG